VRVCFEGVVVLGALGLGVVVGSTVLGGVVVLLSTGGGTVLVDDSAGADTGTVCRCSARSSESVDGSAPTAPAPVAVSSATAGTKRTATGVRHHQRRIGSGPSAGNVNSFACAVMCS
jgi:hypothetical protein